MYKKLHLQLTLFCVLVISVILFGMTALCLSLSLDSRKANRFSEFQRTMNLVTQAISQQDSLSHAWLERIASSNQLELSILDNGKPLLYSQDKDSPGGENLFSKARAVADASYGLLEGSVKFKPYPKHVEFPFDQNLLASVSYIPKGSGILTVTALSVWDNGGSFFTGLILPMFALALAATAFLSAASYFLIRRLIRPLIQLNQQQISFFSAASHELRSPLTVVISSLAAMKNAKGERAGYFFRIAERETLRMRRLINDMFTLSCLDTGTFSVKKEDVDLKNLLIETYERFQPLAFEKKLKISFGLTDTLMPACRCDLERITQVLSILLDNAVSYTPKNGTIRLSLHFQSGRFAITVEDSGPGIPDSEKERVFTRFYRRDASRTDKNHFGLGLSIAHEIMRLHGGKLVLSDSKEGGASFTALLPAGRPEAQTKREP